MSLVVFVCVCVCLWHVCLFCVFLCRVIYVVVFAVSVYVCCYLYVIYIYIYSYGEYLFYNCIFCVLSYALICLYI